MHLERRTAVVQFELFSGATEGSLPLACERDFGVILTIDGTTCPAQNFRSPINDEQWRDFIRKLRDCNVNHDPSGYRGAASIRSLGQQLYQGLVGLSPALREFLGRDGVARRLVIQTTRPELHLLPWGALIDDTGHFLAAGNLSVVQSWSEFSTMPTMTEDMLQLMTVLGIDTNLMTAGSLQGLPPEIRVSDASSAFNAGTAVNGAGILHLEEHGNAALSEVGGVFSQSLANSFSSAKLALLWSCYSGAINSWGESPALCLHRNGAGIVLSFLAELHNLDAKSIAEEFYRDVFGPAASRDPESALVRIRCAKFANEFANANWASMTIYMRSPLDLGALPLNGPRVPKSGWKMDLSADAPAAQVTHVPVFSYTHPPAVAGAPDSGTGDDATDLPGFGEELAESPPPPVAPQPIGTAPPTEAELWSMLATAVTELQPGTVNEFHGFDTASSPTIVTLPASVFRPWRGNVIRIDGGNDPLRADTLDELNLPPEGCPNIDGAERLIWFFDQIQHYGSPLIVWTNAAPRHQNFLKTIEPSTSLTFLLIYGQQTEPTLMELVDFGDLDKARVAADALPQVCSDEELSAAYYAFSRLEDPERAVTFLKRISSPAEMMLLIGNFINRRGSIPNPRPDWLLNHPDGKLTNLQQQHCQEDCFRKVMTNPGSEAPQREAGRARHELGYLLKNAGKIGVAERLYAQALDSLEACPKEQHDSRWHGALGRLLRDWADLLATSPARLEKASDLLRRAMAIHAFRGRRLQIAYSFDTAARIALTGRRFNEAIEHAIESANLFEDLQNWRGWGEAIKLLFDCFAETRDSTNMLSLAELAIDKLHASNLPDDQRELLRMAFVYEKANAYWIAGKFADARSELEKLGQGTTPESACVNLDPDFEYQVKRMWKFLALYPAK
jgi:tetratricopeptide (TPR) repeat protein